MDNKLHRFVAVVFFGVLFIILTACGTNPLAGQVGKTQAGVPVVQEDKLPASPSPNPSPTPIPEPIRKLTPVPSLLSPLIPEPTGTTEKPEKPGMPLAPASTGKTIVVSLSQQWLYAYKDGELVFDHAVETGRPELPTPTGSFTVMDKVRDVMFTSPWPQGSPYYYEPTPVNYGLLFKEGGFFLHDATWHVEFGPGSNVPHQLADGSWETGSHGCVGMSLADAERLYGWAPVGTPVVISD